MVTVAFNESLGDSIVCCTPRDSEIVHKGSDGASFLKIYLG